MSEAERSEKFYRRQVDNFAQLERNTQGLIEKFQMLDEVLSGVIGTRANLTNKWWMRLAGTLIPGIGDSEQLRDAGMNSGFASQLQKMKNAADEEGVPLTLSSGTRDLATQERIFTQRHVEDPNGKVNWDGKTWTLKEGEAPVNPPGQSLHNLGYAADLGPRSSYDWIVANAQRFGLRHGASFGEPWHVAPANITHVSQVPGHQAGSTSTTGTSPFTGIRLSSNSKRQQLGRPDVHLTTGMSMPMAIKTWTEYGRSRTSFEMEGLGDTRGEGYGGANVTISPTFNISGSGGAADADLLAKRVILLIETSEAVRALRRS